MKQQKKQKAFTLIELLVVIAIIAVLSVVVILSLNPAELLRQSRDSNRISDMATLKSAISLYLADVTSISMGTSAICYVSTPAYSPTGSVIVPQTSGNSFAAPTATACSWFATNVAAATQVATVTAANQRNVNATGWIPINFNSISSGAPVGSLPIDPTNVTGTATTNRGTAGFFYTYIPSSASTTFKIAAFTESTKYSNGGGNDIETGDGGNSAGVYEQGTNLAL